MALSWQKTIRQREGRPLDVDIASLGFRYDKDGNITVNLGKISGGFPKLTITQTDPAKGTKTVTTISSLNNKSVSAEKVDITVGADENKEIDIQGITAGGLTISSTENQRSGK